MAADHELRPECAEQFGSIRSDIDNLRDDVREHRSDFKSIIEKIDSNREAVLEAFGKVREDVATLKVKAGVWGTVGGLLSGLVVIGIAVALALIR